MTTTTTNFGWTIPSDTDLVKDGASAMRTLGQAIDTSMMDLEGGTTGQILTKNSGTDMDFVWADNDIRVNSPLNAPLEIVNVSATAATGTINVEVGSLGSVWYYTTSASANFTLNFRKSSSVSLSTLLAVGQSVTITFLNTNGATAYYPTAFQIDGSAVTPKWQGGTAPASGNASAVDAYTFTIIKTASTPSYLVLASQTKFS
ncbi:MAG: hypothetical protein ACR2IJ_11100 [Fluviibacter sp.]